MRIVRKCAYVKAFFQGWKCVEKLYLSVCSYAKNKIRNNKTPLLTAAIYGLIYVLFIRPFECVSYASNLQIIILRQDTFARSQSTRCIENVRSAVVGRIVF